MGYPIKKDKMGLLDVDHFGPAMDDLVLICAEGHTFLPDAALYSRRSLNGRGMTRGWVAMGGGLGIYRG